MSLKCTLSLRELIVQENPHFIEGRAILAKLATHRNENDVYRK